MEKILTKKEFPSWIKNLKSFNVYGPVKKDALWEYERIQDPDKLDLNFKNTVLSPKKIIFPQREVILDFNHKKKGKPEIQEALPEETKNVIFGVRPCDARALTLTDKVFEEEPGDKYYLRRRHQTVTVGLTCSDPPSENCFCTSLGGSPHSTEGLDILMTELNHKYYVHSFTDKGRELMKAASDVFKNPSEKDKKDLKQVHKESEKKIKRQVKELSKITDKLKGMFDSPFWDEESMSCLKCGICTYLCPTCHCFDISDEVLSSSPLKGQRVRTWDTCQFPYFTMHSSGHNPRPDKSSRLRQRILHKFSYFVDNYDDYQCTGCGRCISKCPVDIDIIEVLEKVKDYE
ncbi:MAG: sulfite reductase [Candidatus Aminicenantes bacterium]|nr:sulfite reductase [Candidatus Aminicenantes bacterium]